MNQYIAIFHANLNYAFLHEKDYERVIRASYETIFDTFRDKCPRAKYVFEASGYKYLTLDFESYMTSSDPAYGIAERNRARDIYWGGHLPEYPPRPGM
jgi:hypothetical protein